MKSASMYVERVDMSLICSFSFLLCLFGPLVNVNVNDTRKLIRVY